MIVASEKGPLGERKSPTTKLSSDGVYAEAISTASTYPYEIDKVSSFDLLSMKKENSSIQTLFIDCMSQTSDSYKATENYSNEMFNFWERTSQVYIYLNIAINLAAKYSYINVGLYIGKIENRSA